MPNERIDRLEERLAWFERHVAEQDKVMLEMGGKIDRLKAELGRLRLRSESGGAVEEANPAAERPPHY